MSKVVVKRGCAPFAPEIMFYDVEVTDKEKVHSQSFNFSACVDFNDEKTALNHARDWLYKTGYAYLVNDFNKAVRQLNYGD